MILAEQLWWLLVLSDLALDALPLERDVSIMCHSILVRCADVSLIFN